jgi:ribosomal protein L14E/L6E/L27E
MNELVYKLAKSRAGHDKGSWYAVIKFEGGFAWIADGRRRKIDCPKKKNIKHLEMTRKSVKIEHFTDKSLRKALWDYNFGGAESAVSGESGESPNESAETSSSEKSEKEG